jgi:endonuclease-3 related protein
VRPISGIHKATWEGTHLLRRLKLEASRPGGVFIFVYYPIRTKEELMNKARILESIYQCLLNHLGPRGWWPGESKLEIILGAILTQAVSWSNVEKAIKNLRELELIDVYKLKALDPETLATVITPALYHRQKSKKIKAFIHYLWDQYDGQIDAMLNRPTLEVRKELMSIWGIGPETADSILLYAGGHKIFVVDQYTIRIFSRIGLVPENITYDQMQAYIHNNTDFGVQVYNEYHALLVALGSRYCKKQKPLCHDCPVLKFCKYGNQKTGDILQEV